MTHFRDICSLSWSFSYHTMAWDHNTILVQYHGMILQIHLPPQLPIDHENPNLFEFDPKVEKKKIHSRNNFFLLSSNGQDIIRRCRFLRRRVKSGCANEHGVRVRAWVCLRECVSACMGAGARVCECDREEERPRE